MGSHVGVGRRPGPAGERDVRGEVILQPSGGRRWQFLSPCVCMMKVYPPINRTLFPDLRRCSREILGVSSHQKVPLQASPRTGIFARGCYRSWTENSHSQPQPLWPHHHAHPTAPQTSSVAATRAISPAVDASHHTGGGRPHQLVPLLSMAGAIVRGRRG